MATIPSCDMMQYCYSCELLGAHPTLHSRQPCKFDKENFHEKLISKTDFHIKIKRKNFKSFRENHNDFMLFAKDFFHKKSIQHNWKMKNVGKS
jgi:hypothetical protein